MGFVLAMANLLLCVLASAGYLAAGDLRRGVYWAAAAVITAAVLA